MSQIRITPDGRCGERPCGGCDRLREALEEYRNPDHWILENAEWRWVPWLNTPNPKYSPQDIADKALDAQPCQQPTSAQLEARTDRMLDEAEASLQPNSAGSEEWEVRVVDGLHFIMTADDKIVAPCDCRPHQIVKAHNAALLRVRENLRRQPETLVRAIDFAEWGWSIIANSSGGDWTKESKDWQEAAAKYRDQFHAEIRHLAGIPLYQEREPKSSPVEFIGAPLEVALHRQALATEAQPAPVESK